MSLKHLLSTLIREKYSVTHDELRQRVTLTPTPDSKQKHASFNLDEIFALGCFLLQLSKNKLSAGLQKRMAGKLGPNFWKVINEALADPPAKPLQSVADTRISELEKQLADQRQAHNKCVAEIHEERRQLKYRNDHLEGRNSALERDCQRLCRELDSFGPHDSPVPLETVLVFQPGPGIPSLYFPMNDVLIIEKGHQFLPMNNGPARCVLCGDFQIDGQPACTVESRAPAKAMKPSLGPM